MTYELGPDLNSVDSLSNLGTNVEDRITELENQTNLQLSSISVESLTTNQKIILASAGASSGASTSFFTDSADMQVLNFTRFTMNRASFSQTSKFFLEMVYKAGGNGEAARTVTVDLYDITGGSVVAGGTVSGTNQEGATPSNPGALPLATGTSNFFPNLAGGNRQYVLRYGRTGGPGTAFVDLYLARLVIEP